MDYNRSMRSVEERMRAALTAGEEELWQYVRDPHPDVISNALLNRALTEEMAVVIAKGKAVSAESLGFLAQDVRFKGSYKLKLALCRNPRTPQRVTFSLLKFLRIFDLAEIAKDRQVPVSVRQKIEFVFAERVPSMPLGIKIALARRAGISILMMLMDGGDERVISTCLDSGALTEGYLYKVISRPTTGREVVAVIAAHPRWSCSYQIRFGLIRNFHTPMHLVEKFVTGMKTPDLRDLYADAKLPTATRPFIYRELLERGEATEHPPDEVYELQEDEDISIEDGT